MLVTLTYFSQKACNLINVPEAVNDDKFLCNVFLRVLCLNTKKQRKSNETIICKLHRSQSRTSLLMSSLKTISQRCISSDGM